MRAAFLVAGLFAPAAFALAATPSPGDNVIVLKVSDVQIPPSLQGQCHVAGLVREVWLGAAYKVGQSINLDVPCAVHKPVLEQGPAIKSPPSIQGGAGPVAQPPTGSVDTVVLQQSVTAVVHLNDDGAINWAPTSRPYFRGATVSGYLALSEGALPLGARHASA